MWKSLGWLLTVSLHRQAFGQVLFDPSFPRCHPNQPNPCFDPTQSCPYSVRSATDRASLSICPDKLPLTGMKRCDKRQRTIQRTDGVNGVRDGQCKDPDEAACVATGTNSESGMTAVEYAALKICEDKSNSANRCDLAQRDRCLHPTQDCTAHLHRRNDANNADLTVCSDLVTTGVARCAASQAFPCIDPTVTCTAAINPNVASLAICNDKRDTGDTSRCDIRQVNPCIDPKSECPYADADLARRVTLPICPEKVPRPTVNRCHTSNNPNGGPDNRCIDPRQGFECTVASSGLDAAGFTAYMGTNPKFCEDLAHRDLRCKAEQFRPCIDPSQDCWEPNAGTLNICTDLTPTAGINRCSAQQAHPCIDPRSGQECTSALNPSFANLRICNDLKSQGGVTRCDLRQLVPCYDPRTECPYSVVAKDNPRRRTLPVCLDKASLRRNAIPCHNNNGLNNPANGDAEVRCIHDTNVCVDTRHAALGYADQAAATAALGTMKYCEENTLTETAAMSRCFSKNLNDECFSRNFPIARAADATKGVSSCFPAAEAGGAFCPEQELTCSPQVTNKCLNQEEDFCPNLTFRPPLCTINSWANVVGYPARQNPNVDPNLKRCNEDQPYPCIDPTESVCDLNEQPNPGPLKICADRTHLVNRCDRRNHNPCIDPTIECPTSTATPTPLAVCSDLKHADTTVPRCSVRQPFNKACIDPASPCNASLNPAWQTLKVCEDLASGFNRCDPLQRTPCINPAQPCPHGIDITGLSICADLSVNSSLNRCHTSQNAPCLNPATPCQVADNPAPSTLSICADLARNYNRCHPNQQVPCKDPTAPCTTAINPNYSTLPVCADLVSSAPSTLPSSIPSNLPSLSPSTLPSSLPSVSPSDIPSGQPSLSINPSAAPSAAPSASPSVSPSLSANPSAAPSASPSAMPSASPSVNPSKSPSVSPSSSPSMSPSSSKVPSSTPSFRPTVSVRPTFKGQTYEPSDAPSAMPSSSPSVEPSAPPSIAPSGSPSASPSDRPSASPSTSPSSSPSVSPSGSPSSSPSVSPSGSPTLPGGPSAAPSVNCVDDPDFLLDANENRNCQWAREKPDRVDRRCDKVDSVTNVAVADACPLSCNPECEEFVPTATPVTLEPTVSPETQCGEDDPDFLFQNREGKNCEWVASRPNKTEKRCDKTDTDGELVSTKCTFTCQLRCVCKNSKKKFRLNGEKVKCKDVGRNQCDQGVRFRGRNTFVKERCPKKCNYCFDL